MELRGHQKNGAKGTSKKMELRGHQKLEAKGTSFLMGNRTKGTSQN